MLRQQIDLRAEIQITDVAADPCARDARIAVDNAAEAGIVYEAGRGSAIDARIEQKGAEHFHAIRDAGCEGAGEIRDVRVSLDVVRPAAIARGRPFLRWQHFRRWDEPQSRVAV